ncbi:PREDICTED: interactor of constitutive active ROPs 2, chloroplastic-like [Nelumbo nucifera]|uniref:Interactor of constitutive active ROPs 2, chloroplastic-like n=2 Tax=Nelumbo nucifera TaxID=4432 RepID=A0A1U7ZB24_NELNU|nr:PREDICTED: interactor of constitutive active ROPs 2, chloroplastic-like [Nelumbo nucifera]XP_010244975.1 PREDICTED: interactor of constitutive active ROPs 2, chloroplastic-like [Nelumbo nucifera]XP_010244976.1 PREDICTED: interactor of constitutive active ROPs 2, chloroplastic-like [Nelumbo nucifera]XP_010244977.1 PREDICTED: interactor of constitutive active ROPs 2, chloroplastic-like [Nelumbo nucifera]XP_019051729.1 PREDICTED: interactor of constitutive active ROPs 2, chloroplastic-like [Nel
MQTPKARSGSSEVPQRTSPGTPRAARQLKTTGSESDSVSSTTPVSRTPKDRSPKVVERRSPRSPITEKKRPSRVSELESQLAQLKEDLKKAKDQLTSSETLKRRAQQEAEETKKQLLATTTKLEESQQQFLDLSASEEARLQELRKISQERDRAWQSELEAVQKQHSVDSTALVSAMSEIQRLKMQLEMVTDSEAAQIELAETSEAELQSMKQDFEETLSVVEDMKIQLKDCKESEAKAQGLVSETQLQLETAKSTMEIFKLDSLKAMEAYSSLTSELELSKCQVSSLEGQVSKLQAELANASGEHPSDISKLEESGKHEEIIGSDILNMELNSLKLEVGQLKSALEAAEIRHQEEHIHSTMQIQIAYELVEKTKSEFSLKEAELEAELKKSKAIIEELKARLMDKETELQSISEENEGLNIKIEKNQCKERESELEMELMKAKSDVADLKANLMGKETEIESISKENETLNLEFQKELERNKVYGEAIAKAEAARAAEREALLKLSFVTEEADKSSKKVERVVEQLEAAQAANSEMEAELRRLKVQSDQWRKAAEAAAAVLSTGNNGKFMDRSVSLDGYHHVGKIGSPSSDDLDDDSPKKKNNMLKKIGVLWKKSQK